MSIDVLTIIDLVAAANPGRNKANLFRRVTKLFEELGEVAEAYLNSSSSSNNKKKKWADVREEAADVLIVALDILLTQDDGVAKVREACLRLDRMPMGTLEQHCFHIGANAGRFGLTYEATPVAAAFYGNDMVRNAFLLADLVFAAGIFGGKPVAEASAVKEVTRKLAKWAKNRRDKVVVTDAE
jgi:NTP pyrophosphatase (non-canonical NTP hydrolase)